MRLTRLLGGAVAGLAATAAGNTLLRRSQDDLPPPLGRQLSTYRWRGFDVAYTEAGDPTNPDLVCLHDVSVVGSSQEYRYVIDALAADYHVIAPDLPGFGHSDRPPLQYSSSFYVTFIRDFVRELTDDPHVMASGLTAAYTIVAATDTPVQSCWLINPRARTDGRPRPSLRALLRAPVVGEGLFNAVVSKPAIRYALAADGFASEAAIPDSWVAYAWKTAHQPGARFAPAARLSGFLDTTTPLEEAVLTSSAATTLIWGRDLTAPSLDEGRALATAADVRLIVLDNAKQYPHAEHPAAFCDVLRDVPVVR